MSKLIAFIFGLFLTVWIIVIVILLLIHLSKVIFNRDKVLNFKEFLTLLVWWLPLLSGNFDIVYTMIFDRDKRSKD